MRTQTLAVVLLTMCCAATAAAQDKPPTAQVPVTAPVMQTPANAQVKLTVVVARYQGDKKISSLPYVFGVTAGERTTTSLRMSSEVPIVARTPKDSGGVPSVSYRSVGTNIDCSVNFAGALFRVVLAIEDSSVLLDPDQKSRIAAATNDYPSFRLFKTNFIALLRDGQTMQHTSATDPVSGEVMRVDVTLNVMK